jgi:hypothetical protein
MRLCEQAFANSISDTFDAFLLVKCGGTLKSYLEDERCEGFTIKCKNGKVVLSLHGEGIPKLTVDEIDDSYLQRVDPPGTFEGINVGLLGFEI